MKRYFLATILTVLGAAASADIIENGDLNIIDDPGNPSDGLRFLDMTYSIGLTLGDALTNAQMTYPNTRAATPSEFDDLFAASSLVLDGALMPSDTFNLAINTFGPLSTGANYNTSLRDALGVTTSVRPFTWIITTQTITTQTQGIAKNINLGRRSAGHSSTVLMAGSRPDHGHLLVSEPTAVPEPSGFLCIGLVVLGFAAWKRMKKARQS